MRSSRDHQDVHQGFLPCRSLLGFLAVRRFRYTFIYCFYRTGPATVAMRWHALAMLALLHWVSATPSSPNEGLLTKNGSEFLIPTFFVCDCSDAHHSFTGLLARGVRKGIQLCFETEHQPETVLDHGSKRQHYIRNLRSPHV